MNPHVWHCMLVLIILIPAIPLSGCDNGTHHTQKRIIAKNRLVQLGRNIRGKIDSGQAEPLKDIASRTPGFAEIAFSDIRSANIDPGEFIFLSSSSHPTANDICGIFIISKTNNIVETLVLSPDQGVIGMPDIAVPRFREWLDTVENSNQQLIEQVLELREKLQEETFHTTKQRAP